MILVLLAVNAVFNATVRHDPHERHHDVGGKADPGVDEGQADAQQIQRHRQPALAILADGLGQFAVVRMQAGQRAPGCCTPRHT